MSYRHELNCSSSEGRALTATSSMTAVAAVREPSANHCEKLPVSMVKRGLVTFYSSKLWTKKEPAGESFIWPEPAVLGR